MYIYIEWRVHDVHCPTSSLIGCICGFSADVFAPQLAGSWVQVQHLQSLNTWVDLTIGVPPNSNGISWNIMEYHGILSSSEHGMQWLCSPPSQWFNGHLVGYTIWHIPYTSYIYSEIHRNPQVWPFFSSSQRHASVFSWPWQPWKSLASQQLNAHGSQKASGLDHGVLKYVDQHIYFNISIYIIYSNLLYNRYNLLYIHT